MVKVEFDKTMVKAKIASNVNRAQLALSVQVLKDSNYYCPDAEGTLMRSGRVEDSGTAVSWDTPYARAQYHGFPNKRKDKNPNASTKWFERAKSTKLKQWEALVQNEYEKGN